MWMTTQRQSYVEGSYDGEIRTRKLASAHIGPVYILCSIMKHQLISENQTTSGSTIFLIYEDSKVSEMLREP